MQNFSELKLPLVLEKALKVMKFESPTPIQAKAIPVALQHKDLIGQAQTGTGKTAAFCIPLVARLLENPNQTALILAPTRELAIQISDVLEELTLFAKEIKTALLIGGMSMQTQEWAIQRSPQIVVATPGRLVDHLKRRTLSLASVGMLVLDEADRMLDLGFSRQLNEILRYLPNRRQTLVFSATIPPDIERLSEQYVKDPVRVSIGQNSRPAEKIQQSIVKTTIINKVASLLTELRQRKGKILIFARTKHRTDRLSQHLEDKGHQVTRLHGDRTQGQRISSVTGFKNGRYRILVATDIAARGIDISQIAHVINFDLPLCPEDYVHRIGRTARAGAEGEAVSLITPEDRNQWNEITRFLAKSSGPMAG